MVYKTSPILASLVLLAVAALAAAASSSESTLAAGENQGANAFASIITGGEPAPVTAPSRAKAAITRNSSRPETGKVVTVSVTRQGTTQTIPAGTVLWRINAGGGEYFDSSGNEWSPDLQYFNTGNIYRVTTSVSGTPDPTLFQSDRWGPPTPPELGYTLPVPNGNYTIVLYFAEVYPGTQQTGARVFNVTLQGAVVISKLDVYAEAGANTALTKTVPASVTNGVLTIGFQHVVENPMISAIEVISQGGPDQAPSVALSASPTSGSLPLPVQFSSTGSSDPDGVITKYHWDFGDGNVSSVSNPVHVYNQAGTYTVQLTVTDNAGLQSSTTTSVTTNAPTGLPLVYRINAGGPVYKDNQSEVWEADKGFNTGNIYANSVSSISGASDPTIFQTARYSSSQPALQYSLAVPNGNYQVNLYFAETYPPLQAVGKRVFNVQMEGNTVFQNLDVYAAVGANAMLVKTADVSVSNGILTIGFQPVVQNPFVNAIEVYSLNPPASLKTAIKHVIWMMQENRTFDNYFGMMGQYRSAKGFTDPFDGLPSNVSLLNGPTGRYVSPYLLQTMCEDNLSAGWNPSGADVDGGKMDQFMLNAYVASSNDPNYTRPMGYFDQTELTYYYPLAFNFGTSDRFFSSMLGPTPPNRMYAFSATSFGNIDEPSPVPPGGYTQPTIFDRLTAAGISWRIYYQDQSHIMLKNYSTYGTYQSNVYPISQYLTDVQSESTLPQFVFIERGGGTDEHPGADVNYGAQQVTQYINALMASPTWQDSVFILNYDEGGGNYDHVPPVPMVRPDNVPPNLAPGDTIAEFNETGFRVPFLIVSPWIRPHFVSHTPREHTSVLKLVERLFGLDPLTQRDAEADDMQEFFNFAAPQMTTIPTFPPQRAAHTCDYTVQKAPGFLSHDN